MVWWNNIKRPFTLSLILLFGVVCYSQSKIDYSNWQLVFEDEFDTYSNVNEMRQNWRFDYPWEYTLIDNTTEYEKYTPDNILLDSGTLILRAKKLDKPITYLWKNQFGLHKKALGYTSGMIMSNFTFDEECYEDSSDNRIKGFAYGMFQIRCKLPPGTGTWPAFWLYSGFNEIDILESYDEKWSFASTVHDNLSTPKNVCSNDFKKIYGPSLTEEFHTYTAVWTPEQISIFFDDVEIWTTSKVNTSACPAAIIANLAIFDHATIDSSDYIIDYIRAYKTIDPSLPFRNSFVWDFSYADSIIGAERRISINPGSVLAMDGKTVYYRGTDNLLKRFVLTNDNWNFEEIPFTYTSAQKISGELFKTADKSIFYRGNDGRLRRFYFATNTWQNEIIDDGNFAAYSKISPDQGSMTIYEIGSEKYIYYRGIDDKLHQYYYKVGQTIPWIHTVLTNTTASGNLLDGSLTSVRNQVYYKGRDGYLHLQTSNHTVFTDIGKLADNNYAISVNPNAGTTTFNMFLRLKSGEVRYYPSTDNLTSYSVFSTQPETMKPIGKLWKGSDDRLWYRGSDKLINYITVIPDGWSHAWPSSWGGKFDGIYTDSENLSVTTRISPDGRFGERVFFRTFSGLMGIVEEKVFASPDPPCNVGSEHPQSIY